MNYHEIGQRIRKLRRAHGLSQEELAEKVGISTVHMSHIETGKTKLSLPVFVALARSLDVRTDELLYDASPAARSAAIETILKILDSCTTQQIQIMEDILGATKASLQKNL